MPPCTDDIADTDADGIAKADDIDKDGDGLIEICDLEGLNEIRYQLDGTGYRANPTSDTNMTGCPSGVCRGYELTRSLDFDDNMSYRDASLNKSQWTSGSGWVPIGLTFREVGGLQIPAGRNAFTGSFHGNGHTISNLLIGFPNDSGIALFALTGDRSSITAVHLLNVDILGALFTGGLVGENFGSITDSSVTGEVDGTQRVGGLVGDNRGSIMGSHAAVTVRLRGFGPTNLNIGGLVGRTQGGMINNSYATGNVDSGGYQHAGGFIGTNVGTVINSCYATGEVRGGNDAGGLIGSNAGEINNSYAVGNVSGGNNVGGLIGSNSGAIINSYHAIGTVTGSRRNVGGFIGLISRSNSGNIINSYATGDVIGASGSMDVGGFIGKSSDGNRGNIINSYATGDVTGAAGVNNIGGFIGFIDSLSSSANQGGILNSYAAGDVTGSADKTGGFIGSIDNNVTGAISNNYASGNVSGNTKVGGFVGEALSTKITSVYAVGNVSGNTEVGGLVGATGGGFSVDNSYWDRERSGTEMSAGGEAKTTVELQSTEIGKGIYEQWSQTDWYSGTNGDYPLLRYTRGTGVVPSPACVDEGQPNNEGYPICGTFLDTDRFLGLQALTISTVADPTTNLLQDNFEVQRQNYSLTVLPTIEALRFEPIPVSDEVTVEVDGESFNTSATVALDFTQNKDEISITVAAEGSTATYTVTVYQTGLCDNNSDGVINNQDDIDKDDDGLIELCSPIGLDAIRYQMDGRGYKADVDAPIVTDGCSNNTGICTGYELEEDITNLNESFDNWQPIGDDTTPFAAIFDGNGHTISGLSMDRADDNYIGLFGYTAQNSTITNVGLIDIAKSVRQIFGFTLEINGIVGLQYVGGLVGKNEGVVGNSYVNSSFGIVANPTGDENNEHVGGLVGDNAGAIINSYAALPVAGTHNNIGGLVGKNSGDITNSYAIGSIDGGNRVGGLVGYLESGGTIKRSYAAGRVSASRAGNVGGLVGFADNTNNEVVDSHWDTITSGQTNSDGGIDQITTRLQSDLIATPGIYANWHADDWFSGSSGDYPVLRYANISESTPLCGQPGQPVCGDLLGGQRILALRALMLSKIGETTNLIREDFVPHITTYTLIITPDITTLDISLELYDSEATVKVNDMAIDISTKTEVQVQDKSVVRITVEMGDLAHTYSVEIHRVGLCDTGDIDMDDDGLIELCLPLGFEAIRHQLDGSAYKVNSDANAPVITDGCSNNTGICNGYELGANLDFGDAGNRIPVGDENTPFATMFDGNGYTISNLTITTTTEHVGLFGYTAQNSTIKNVGLLGVNIEGKQAVGSLVGTNKGIIANSYARGAVSATDDSVGGLVGDNHGNIFNSYANAEVSGSLGGGLIGLQSVGKVENSYANSRLTNGDNMGGFIGRLDDGTISNTYTTSLINGGTNAGGFVAIQNDGEISNSYAVGRVFGDSGVSGFLSRQDGGTVTDSYWDRERSGIATSADGTSKTTAELKVSEIGDAGGIYENWKTEDWDSGTEYDYPILRYTQGDDPANPLCGSDELPCDIVLAGQFVPLNKLVLLSGTTTPEREEDLEPAFDPRHYTYRSTINLHSQIQFVIAAPTTRTVSYRINDGEFIDLGSEVGSTSKRLPSVPITLDAGETTVITIKVDPLDTQANQDSGGEYTFEIEHGTSISVQVRLLLEGALRRQP